MYSYSHLRYCFLNHTRVLYQKGLSLFFASLFCLLADFHVNSCVFNLRFYFAFVVVEAVNLRASCPYNELISFSIRMCVSLVVWYFLIFVSNLTNMRLHFGCNYYVIYTIFFGKTFLVIWFVLHEKVYCLYGVWVLKGVSIGRDK